MMLSRQTPAIHWNFSNWKTHCEVYIYVVFNVTMAEIVEGFEVVDVGNLINETIQSNSAPIFYKEV